VLSFLTMVGGVLVGVGVALQQSPGQNWSTFVVDIGVALGSVVLGVVGVVAARRLLDSGLAAVATWHAPPTAA
jgi:drug/metabolite transporter (DMT)-like permease